MRLAMFGKVVAGVFVLAVLVIGCGANVSLFNPAFINSSYGGIYPLTPGPNADFVLVRTVNTTEDAVIFFVTIERSVLRRDDDGLVQFDDAGQPLADSVFEHVELLTRPTGQANELGVLFPCSAASGPVITIGLGEDLLPTDPAVFVIPAAQFNDDDPFGPQPGFGVTAENVNPLLWSEGNFNCGDTVIFRAISSSGMAGGVKIQQFLLPGSEQPINFRNNTFYNYEQFLESQVREEETP